MHRRALLLLGLLFLCVSVRADEEDDDEDEPDEPRITLDVAKSALRDAMKNFNIPSNKQKIKEAMGANDDQMTRMMTVMPIIQEIQADVMAKYGFDSAMDAMSAMQEHNADPEIAR